MRWLRRSLRLAVLLPAMLLAAALVRAPRLPVFAPQEPVRLAILMYHSIAEDPARAASYVTPLAALSRDLYEAAARGWHFVSPEELLAFAAGEGTLPEKALLLTFDDGYYNNLRFLPPLLEEYDAYAVIAAVGEICDQYTAERNQASVHAGMSWEALAQADVLPRLTLANHSYYFHHTAPRFGAGRRQGEAQSVWAERFRADTLAMQEAMAAHGCAEPVLYAYPYGQVEAGADAILSELGFAVSFSCRERINLLPAGEREALFSLGRFNRDGRLTSAQIFDRLDRLYEEAK